MNRAALTELAVLFLRGWPGLVVAGCSFIIPACLIVSALAWAYVRFGRLPPLTGLLYGLKPVVITVVLQALWVLAAIVDGWTAALALISAVLLVRFRVSSAWLILGGALVGLVVTLK